MGETLLLHDRWERMWRDDSRDQLPDGALWTLTDWIPGEADGPLGKRGGWSYASGDLSGILNNADNVIAAVYAPFAAGSQLVAVAQDTAGGGTYRLGQIVSSSSTTDRGATQAVEENPTFYRQKVYLCKGAGDAAPDTYDGSSNATDLTGSPPNGSRSAVYKDHLVLARSSAELQRVWFSGPGEATSWDTTNGYLDTTGQVRGLWPLKNTLLVFHKGFLERIVGSIPPPGTDMSIQPVSDIGLEDARSLAGTNDFVCFANAAGVYLTDGAAVADLTIQGGMKSYWSSLQTTLSPITSVVGGIYRGYYFVCVRGSAAVTLACHIETRRWFVISNVNALCFARRVSLDVEELYFGSAVLPRVGYLSSLFNPASGVKADADGTVVAPVVELPFYQTGKSYATFANLFVVYDIRDAGDNPILTCSYVSSPESTSYVTVKDYNGSSYTLAETAKATRVKRRLHYRELGIGLKIQQTNASANTRLYRCELEAMEGEDTDVYA